MDLRTAFDGGAIPPKASDGPRTHLGDVRPFDRLASLYELGMPPADGDRLATALSVADRRVERGLDVGGGTGRGAETVPGVDWAVVDAAPGMLREARGKGLAAVNGDATRLPVRSDSVDAVLIVDALHHFGCPRAAVDEAARVLRPGGVLVVAEFDPATLRGRTLVAAEHLVGFDSTFLTPLELAVVFEDAGLLVDVVDAGFAYTLAGVKPQDR